MPPRLISYYPKSEKQNMEAIENLRLLGIYYRCITRIVYTKPLINALILAAPKTLVLLTSYTLVSHAPTYYRVSLSILKIYIPSTNTYFLLSLFLFHSLRIWMKRSKATMGISDTPFSPRNLLCQENPDACFKEQQQEEKEDDPCLFPESEDEYYIQCLLQRETTAFGSKSCCTGCSTTTSTSLKRVRLDCIEWIFNVCFSHL